MRTMSQNHDRPWYVAARSTKISQAPRSTQALPFIRGDPREVAIVCDGGDRYLAISVFPSR